MSTLYLNIMVAILTIQIVCFFWLPENLSYITLHWLHCLIHFMSDFQENYVDNLEYQRNCCIIKYSASGCLTMVKYSVSGIIIIYIKPHGLHYRINLLEFLTWILDAKRIWSLTRWTTDGFCLLSSLSMLFRLCTPV